MNSATYSALIRLQHASHVDTLPATVPPPVFLLGFWRSGTTFLHELFCCDPRFGFPSTYACLNSSHFLLTERWGREEKMQRQVVRPMDNMRYSWTSPQEDEFALLALGAPSPYEALLVPSLLRKPHLLLRLHDRSRDEQQRWKEVLLYFLRLLTYQQGKPMVLKSPPHGFKLSILSSLFPEARFVVIERNPYEVFASNLRLWQRLLEMYSLESFSSEDIEDFVLAAYPIHREAVAEGARHLNPKFLAMVRYEQLVADPIGEMARLYRELGFQQSDGLEAMWTNHMAEVANHERNRFLLSLAQKTRVDERWGAIMRERGYDWRDDYVTLTAPSQSLLH